MVQTHVIASVLGCMVNAWGASSFGMFSQGRFAGTRLSATITLDGEKLRGPITPVGNFVLVQNKDTLAATAGGILLPDQVGLKVECIPSKRLFKIN